VSVPGRPLPSRLYAIADADVAAAAGWDVPDLVDTFLQAGARFIQIRAKSTPGGQLLAWVDRVAALAGDAWIIVNDRVDVALVAGTRHVHLGQDDLPVRDARLMLGADAVIGLSTHTPDQIARACALPVDYIAVGPVFGTHTKDTGYTPVGLALVAEARRQADASGARPVVAIGGITLDTARATIEAGAGAVVVISDLLRGGNPAGRVRAYLSALDEV